MGVGQEFAGAVLEAFKQAGVRTDTDVARANGPSTSHMTKLRKAAKGEGDMPKPRKPTLDAIDRTARWAPGSAARVWDGGAPEPLPPAGLTEPRPIGEPSDELVEFRVSGSFGVQAVVRGPIRDIDALQAAVSKLIADMRTEESSEVRHVT